MKRIETEINKKCTLALMERNFIFVAVSGVVGLALVALYFIFGALNNEWAFGWYIAMLIVGILVLAFDGILLYNIIKNVNLASKDPYTIGVTFKDDFLVMDMTKDKQQYQQARIAYKDIMAFNVTKEYVFIRVNKTSSIPVLRSEEVVNFLKEKGIRKF